MKGGSQEEEKMSEEREQENFLLRRRVELLMDEEEDDALEFRMTARNDVVAKMASLSCWCSAEQVVEEMISKQHQKCCILRKQQQTKSNPPDEYNSGPSIRNCDSIFVLDNPTIPNIAARHLSYHIG